MHPQTTKTHAFTLIELLVVISIIALLVAILLPALNAARTTAQLTQSMSNVRQLGIALNAYANDNKSSLPYGWENDTNPLAGDGPYWSGLLLERDGGANQYGYVKDWRVFWGPNRNMELAKEHAVRWQDENGDWQGSHWFSRPGYGAAGDAGPMPMQSKGHLPYRFGGVDIPDPTEQMLLVESFDNGFFNSGNQKDGRWRCEPWLDVDHGFGTNGSFIYTYNGNAPRVYMDGHASGGKSSEIGWRATNARHGFWTLWPSTAFDEAPWFQRD